MIQFQDDKTPRETNVPAHYPAYYRGYVFNSYYVAVLSRKLAIKVSVVPTDLFVRKGTLANVFQSPGFEDYEPIEREDFIEALQRAKLVMDELMANVV